MSSARSDPWCVAKTRSLSIRTWVICPAPSLRDGERHRGSASRATARPADEKVPRDAPPHPPLLNLIEVRRVGELPDGRISGLVQSYLGQHLEQLLPGVLQRDARLREAPVGDVLGPLLVRQHPRWARRVRRFRPCAPAASPAQV